MDMNAAAHQLDLLLEECIRLEASDLHLSPGLAPYFRIHGELIPHEKIPALLHEEVEGFASLLMKNSGDKDFKTKGAQDGALTTSEGTRFRFNIYRRLGGISIALRHLEDRFQTLNELGLPESLYSLCDLPDGIVLLAGPTGAGKSTTIAALIDRINRKRRAHIITIEDPIEYIHSPILSLIDQRQVGADASSFNDALVSSLREDPDVILVGEVRDLETIRTAIHAAETGHLVFTTVHAGDSVGTIERMVSVFPADEQAGIRQQLSLVLRAIITQHLLPVAAKNGNEIEERFTPRGRVVASEVLICNSAVSHLVATARSAQIYSTMEGGGKLGMQTLEQDLARLWLNGRISEATALTTSRNPNSVRERVAALTRRHAERRAEIGVRR